MPPSPEEPIEMGGMLLESGSRIGSYVFLRAIGSGGMARVLLAKDPAGQLVALKVLRKSRFKTGLARFRREFRALSRIHHPNVIRVEAYGDLHGHPFIAMEYVDGPDLHSKIREFRTWDPERRWRRVEQVLIDLCRALSAIHRRGLVHRDLKPSNVLVNREDICKLTDFGIVKDLDPSHDPHLSTTLVGTWAYASPEQITGSPLDHRSDLYSLGVILFAMLTGKRPFVANDMAGYLALHRDRPAPAPRDVSRNVPEHLDEICRRLLQKAPRDRYQSAQEILYRLEAEERMPPARPFDGWRAPLVGRDLEREAITDAVAGLTASRGGMLVLEGDDGVGKTRLLEVAEERARALGIPVIAARFDPGGLPFATLLGLAMRALDDLGGRGSPHVKTVLQRLLNLEAIHAEQVGSVVDACQQAFASVLDEGPRLVLIDDVHEASPRAIGALTLIARRILGELELPMLLVASVRSHANHAADALASGQGVGLAPKEMSVEVLSREDVTQLVHHLVGNTVAARTLAQRLFLETEGNASLLDAFIQQLLERGLVRPTLEGGHELHMQTDEIADGHFDIPASVRQMMRDRLTRVAPGELAVLQVLAVERREIDLDVLIEVVDRDEEVVIERLEALITAGIARMRDVGSTTFASVVQRKLADVVYRDLPAERRADLHRRLAAAMELHYANQPAALEIVGDHYRQAGDAGRAYRYLVAAAKRLADRLRMAEAWDLTERAGTLAESARTDLDDAMFAEFRHDHLTVRATVLSDRAEWTDAEVAWRAVLDVAGQLEDPRATSEAQLQLATVLRHRGELEASRQLANLALNTSRHLHFREGMADALLCLAELAWAEGRPERSEPFAAEALEIAKGRHLAGRRAELLRVVARAQTWRGELASATQGLAEAEGIFQRLKRKRSRCLALANLAELLMWQGQPVEARQRAHVALELSRELQYRVGLLPAMRVMGSAAVDLGLHEEARPALFEVETLADTMGQHDEQVAGLTALVRLELDRGDPEQARTYGRKALTVLPSHDPRRARPLVEALLAIAEAPDHQDAARQLADRAERGLDRLPVAPKVHTSLALARARFILGNAEAGIAHARQTVALAETHGFSLVSMEAHAMLARRGPKADRAHHEERGRDGLKRLLGPLAKDMARALQDRPGLQTIAIGSSSG
ncbi:MAG: protein kinase [Myxococcota bacterium]